MSFRIWSRICMRDFFRVPVPIFCGVRGAECGCGLHFAERKTMTIPESVRYLISRGLLAHVTTLNSDGSPQVTVVWVGIEDDEIVSGHLHLHHKLKNIHRDPRVAVSI